MHRFTLDNGLRALVLPSSAAPLAAIYLWVDAGAADELPGEEGAAHFLEHMVFKGTARRGVGAAAGEIEGLGGDLNAFTSWEQTVLHATVEASAWREALDIVVDMARNPTIDPAEFDREKQVVIEELRGYLDDPESVVADETVARLYPDHPYGRPIVGFVESLAPMRPEELRAFHDRCWVPGRVVLSVAGDVDPAEVEAAARALLADWQPGAARAAVPQPPPPRTGPLKLARDFETTAVEIAWRTPPLGHPDIPALDVLTAALGDGAASLLPVRLQMRDSLATDVSASMSSHAAAGDLSVGFLPREGYTYQAIATTLEEIARVIRHGVTGAQISRAREACLADFLFSEETVDGRAHDAAWFMATMGDPLAQRAYRAALAAVTAADVRRVARRWLDPADATIISLDKALTERDLAEAATPPVPVRAAQAPHAPMKTVLPNGATLWVLPDDTPVAAVRITALGGGLAVDARRAGAHTLWSRGVTAGAGDLDAEAFAGAIDDVAGTLDGVAGRNLLGISATFPAEHVEEGLGLVGLALTEPWFDGEELDRLREELIEEVRTLPDRPGETASNRLWATLWAGHPWRLPSTGTEASLNRIGSGTLRKLHDRLLTADNVVVAVAGGVDPDAVRDTLGPWLEALPAGPFALDARPEPPPVRGGVRRLRAGREQAWVLIGARTPPLHDPSRLPLQVAAAILGGQGGRLFLSLREARGLAYSVWARAAGGWDGGVFQAGLATEPGRIAEAEAALRAELARMAATPPHPDEVARYCRMLVGQAAMGLQRASGRAADVALSDRLGLPSGIDALRQALGALTPEDVHAAYAALWEGEPAVVVVEPER